MPLIDFSSVDAISNFPPLPNGEYLCTLKDVEPGATRAGDVMLHLRWAVETGEHVGRLLFDNLVFSPKALPRVELICASCGLDVTREIDLEPNMLLGERVCLTTLVEEYVDDHGATKVRNRIPYEGYAPVHDDDNVPF